MEPNIDLSKRLTVIAGAVALAGVLVVVAVSLAPGSQAAPLAGPTPVSTDLPYREPDGAAESPLISFIDSPSATCYRPLAETDACYIRWEYLSVTAASGSYVLSMTVSIADRMRAYHSGFFQSSMDIPAEMTAPGYKVSCGLPGTGNPPGYGNTYNYTIRARETTGLAAANYGTTTCPADTVGVYLPVIIKQ